MLFGETVAVYCENHTEHTDTLCGQNAGFINVKGSGAYIYQCSLKGCAEITLPFHLYIMFFSVQNIAAVTQQTSRRHIPEDDTLHNHRCENFKSYIMKVYFKKYKKPICVEIFNS
jgi:hypothetical protein